MQSPVECIDKTNQQEMENHANNIHVKHDWLQGLSRLPQVMHIVFAVATSNPVSISRHGYNGECARSIREIERHLIRQKPLTTTTQKAEKQ